MIVFNKFQNTHFTQLDLKATLSPLCLSHRRYIVPSFRLVEDL
ncbi:MAG: hypothetical protein PUI01_03910 [Campylobacteraceae bacterium]|nr:hypothetical protein [Campylobacteraceae bacterium]